MIEHPKRLEEITPDWMTWVLGQAAGGDGPRVNAIEVESLGGAGRGFLSGVARIRLDREAVRAGAPESLVVKLPTSEAYGREIALANDAYLRELRFYREIAPESPVRVPRCHLAALDPDRGDYLLVLEDAKAWRPGDQVAGLSPAEAAAAIGMIGRFHARWWRAPALAALDWVPREISLSFRDYGKVWPEFLARHGARLSADDRANGARIAENGPALAQRVAAGPETLAHCDFRADNLMLGQSPGGAEVMILDWQWLTRTLGAYDVARLVCGSLPSRLSDTHHRDLLGTWHAALLAGGVVGYGFADAWRDYQAGILQYTYVPVVCHSLFSHEGGRSADLLAALIDRTFHAVRECRAMEALADLT